MGDKLPTLMIRNLAFGTLGFNLKKSPATPHFYVIFVRIEAYIEGIMDPLQMSWVPIGILVFPATLQPQGATRWPQ